MNKNQERNKIQAEAVSRSKKHKYLCLEWATGCGKTLGTAKILEFFMSKKNDLSGYLVCKESTHVKNWKDDFIKHNKEKILNRTETILYASLHKAKENPDFIVLDECHALTTKRAKELKRIIGPSTRVILLSATIPKEKLYLINRICPMTHFYKIDLNKAFKIGLLPEPKIVVHKIKLRNEDSGKLWNFTYRKAKKGSNITKYCKHKDLFKVLKSYPKSVGIVLQGTEQEYYDAITSQMAYYDKLSQDTEIPYPVRTGCRNKYLNLGTVRKRFIAEVKTSRVANLVSSFRDENKRFICFTGSVDQSIKIGSKNAVHSKNKKEVNQGLVDCFNNNKCSELFAVKMLREGVNLTNIEKGIITQIDSGIGSFFQMLGRCLRHEFPELHMFVLQDTQDVVYFNKSMKNFNKKYVKYKEYG